MEGHQDVTVVAASSKTGEAFIRQLLKQGIPFAAIANHRAEEERLKAMGVKRIVTVDTSDETTWILPEFPVGKVFVFENSFNLSCRYIRICRTWTTKPLYVITHSVHPRLVYRGLGADHIIHTSSRDVSFLIMAPPAT